MEVLSQAFKLSNLWSFELDLIDSNWRTYHHIELKISEMLKEVEIHTDSSWQRVTAWWVTMIQSREVKAPTTWTGPLRQLQVHTLASAHANVPLSGQTTLHGPANYGEMPSTRATLATQTKGIEGIWRKLTQTLTPPWFASPLHKLSIETGRLGFRMTSAAKQPCDDVKGV